jgi:hypothetical protein
MTNLFFLIVISVSGWFCGCNSSPDFFEPVWKNTLLTTAIAIVERNPGYAEQRWPVLTTWADYLLKEGLDPESQFCTDDFAGHFARNANLSIKAITGVAGYGKLAGMMGDKETAARYLNAAKGMALQWTQMADGNYCRPPFDQPNIWSRKYNLVWDKCLPLDSRKDDTKSDWIIWSACLADDEEDFRQIMFPVHVYASETVSHIPLSDWHDTKDSHSMNFRARSVVGGYFMKMLKNKTNIK